MKKNLILTLATLILAASSAFAQQTSEEDMLGLLKSKYPATTFKKVQKSEIPGVFEVVMGKNVAYTDKSGRYFLFGHLYDMETQTDLTEERKPADMAQTKAVNKSDRIDFAELNLDDAIKFVQGDGSRKMAVFSDPDCPYCKNLEQTLEKIGDLTIYLFLMPIQQLHPQAPQRAESVWCSDNPASAWKKIINVGEVVEKQCNNPIQRNLSFAEKHGINGTPTMIFENGDVVPGALQAKVIEQLLREASNGK